MKVQGVNLQQYYKNAASKHLNSCTNLYKSQTVSDMRADNDIPFYGLPINKITGKAQETAEAMVNEIINAKLKDSYAISRIKQGVDALRFNIGEPIEGFRGLYKTKALAAKYSNDNNIYLLYNTENSLTGNISVFDSSLNEIKNFTKDEITALKEYKYFPEIFHGYLRHDRFRGLLTREDFNSYLSLIDNVFKNDKKVFETSDAGKLYRALQPDLTKTDLEELNHIGGIFTDKSFVSTSTDLETAKRFLMQSPGILEINVPKGTKYLDMDKLFDIQMKRWREDEYLLNRSSRFVVTGYDRENKIIKVDYLGVE